MISLTKLKKLQQRFRKAKRSRATDPPRNSRATVQRSQMPNNTEERSQLLRKCSHLAEAPDILEKFRSALRSGGFAGDTRNAELLYLACTARLLSKPVSIAIKGPSASGKSFQVRCVLKFFPDDAWYGVTSMSPHALAHWKEPLKHRILFINEVGASTCQGFMNR